MSCRNRQLKKMQLNALQSYVYLQLCALIHTVTSKSKEWCRSRNKIDWGCFLVDQNQQNVWRKLCSNSSQIISDNCLGNKKVAELRFGIAEEIACDSNTYTSKIARCIRKRCTHTLPSAPILITRRNKGKNCSVMSMRDYVVYMKLIRCDKATTQQWMYWTMHRVIEWVYKKYYKMHPIEFFGKSAFFFRPRSIHQKLNSSPNHFFYSIPEMNFGWVASSFTRKTDSTKNIVL